ncbi:PIN domain-containing protein [Patulibacter sp. NPDC049589]|uniref:PIN domain-containing protein n=1 Tax=Patulibacter sp. NPDC049589 TaxID=3154731 RepID=UPI003417EEF0
MSWPGEGLLADKSAWARVARYPDAWSEALRTGQLAICSVVHLELLYSARSRADIEALDVELGVVRELPVTRGTLEAAKGAMLDLASAGGDRHHRVSPADAIIAACAAEHGHGVLHYDAHYDRLATVLGFDSVWVVPRGSVP